MRLLGSEVKRLRESKGLTQAQLASDSHLGMSFIWGVENRRETECSSWELHRLSKALGVPEDMLPRLAHPNFRGDLDVPDDINAA